MYKVHRHYYLYEEVGPRQGRHRQEPAAELRAAAEDVRGEEKRRIEDTLEVAEFEVSAIESDRAPYRKDL